MLKIAYFIRNWWMNVLPVRNDSVVTGPQSCFSSRTVSSNLRLCRMILPDSSPTATTCTAGAWKATSVTKLYKMESLEHTKLTLLFALICHCTLPNTTKIILIVLEVASSFMNKWNWCFYVVTNLSTHLFKTCNRFFPASESVDKFIGS